MAALSVLQSLGLTDTSGGAFIGDVLRSTSGPALTMRTPIDGAVLAQIATAETADVAAAVAAAQEAFLTWRLRPAPQRGELVRRIGNRLRERKRDLAQLVTLEAGKIVSEADRRDHRVQLSGRGLGVERHARPGMRRQRRLETGARRRRLAR